MATRNTQRQQNSTTTTKNNQRGNKMKQSTKKAIWKKQIIKNNKNIEKNIADLAAHLMTYRFKKTPADEFTFKTANKWVRRIEENTHFLNADEKTAQALLDWYAQRSPALRRIIK